MSTVNLMFLQSEAARLEGKWRAEKNNVKAQKIHREWTAAREAVDRAQREAKPDVQT